MGTLDAEYRKKGEVSQKLCPLSQGPDIDGLRRPCHNEISLACSSSAVRDEPYIASGGVAVCRSALHLPSSPRFLVDKLNLVAELHPPGLDG
jgi:hypothetical protein